MIEMIQDIDKLLKKSNVDCTWITRYEGAIAFMKNDTITVFECFNETKKTCRFTTKSIGTNLATRYSSRGTLTYNIVLDYVKMILKIC